MNSTDSFFIFINKPEGLTSHQTLTKFKRKYGFKKVGHHGTLDPFATGLLLVGVNEATKFFSYIDDLRKSYMARLCLGVKTDTLDRTGQVVDRCDVPLLAEVEIQKNLEAFAGRGTQVPPMYSAVKVDGKKLYELARQGKEIERKPREIEIFEITLKSWESPYLTIETTVSRGTYIRVLAEEIAARMKTFAHLDGLVRTELCGQPLSVAHDLCDVELARDKQMGIAALLHQYPQLSVSEAQLKDLFFGRRLECSKDMAERVLAIYQGICVGILEKQGNYMKSLRLIDPATLPSDLSK